MCSNTAYFLLGYTFLPLISVVQVSNILRIYTVRNESVIFWAWKKSNEHKPPHFVLHFYAIFFIVLKYALYEIFIALIENEGISCKWEGSNAELSFREGQKTLSGGLENVRKSRTAVVSKIWNILEKKRILLFDPVILMDPTSYLFR